MYKEDYNFIREHLRNLCGIDLGDDRQFLVEARLEPILIHKSCKNLSDLVTLLRRSPDAELTAMLINALTTNESLFFRDVYPFLELQNAIIPMLMKNRSEKKL